MGEQLDAPNQQVVRPDGSGPADEGEGGSTRDEAAEADTTADEGTAAGEKPKQPKSTKARK